MDGTYYLQVLLEECKYIVKEKKIKQYINDDLQISSNDSIEKISDKSDKKGSEKEYIR